MIAAGFRFISSSNAHGLLHVSKHPCFVYFSTMYLVLLCNGVSLSVFLAVRLPVCLPVSVAVAAYIIDSEGCTQALATSLAIII